MKARQIVHHNGESLMLHKGFIKMGFTLRDKNGKVLKHEEGGWRDDAKGGRLFWVHDTVNGKRQAIGWTLEEALKNFDNDNLGIGRKSKKVSHD